MKKDSPRKITLLEYFESQARKSLYTLLPERYLLAAELLNTYNDQATDSNGNCSIAPFINLENVEIESIPSDDADEVPAYSVNLPSVPLDDKTQYTNYAFGDSRLFNTKHILGKVQAATCADVIRAVNKDSAYSIRTLATVAFCIYFGTHPLKGREYYKTPDISSESDKSFFEGKHNLIFQIENNPNRFVNGYQSIAFTVWNSLTNNQRDFWIKAFGGAYKSYREFYSEWKSCYGFFTISYALTECAHKLKAIVFDENYALVVSDNSIGNKTIRCRGCNNSLADKCDSCQIPTEKRNANLFTINAKIGVVGTSEEKALPLYEGRTISVNDLDGKGGDTEIFEVIASKKNNLLGLRYLSDKPITVIYGSQTKQYNNDNIIPLFPGVHIQALEGYEIITPGQPPEPKPTPKPVDPSVSTETSKPVDSQQSADTVITTPSNDFKPITKINKQKLSIESNVSSRTIVPSVSSKPLPSKTIVMLENGEHCEIKNAVLTSEKYVIYEGTMVETGKSCRLKLYYSATPADEATCQNMIDRIKHTMQYHRYFHPSILYPNAIVDSHGAFEKYSGFVSPDFPCADMTQLIAILKGSAKFASRQAVINAMIELCQMVESLHNNKFMLMHRYINPYSIYVNVKTGKCCLVQNEYISSDASLIQVSDVVIPFYDPVAQRSRQYTPESDIYSVAVVMFTMMFAMHPFDDCRYSKRMNAKDSKASISELVRKCTSSPSFCFSANSDKITDGMLTFNTTMRKDENGNLIVDCDDADDEIKDIRKDWDTIDYNIRDLFIQTFEDGVKNPSQRPTLQQWIARLKRWQSDLQSKKLC